MFKKAVTAHIFPTPFIKPFIRFLLFGSLLSFFPAFADETSYETPKSATIISTRPSDTTIYLRPEPRFSAKSIGRVAVGAEPLAIAESKQRERLPWYRIKLSDGQTGWVYGQYVRLAPDSAPKPSTQENGDKAEQSAASSETPTDSATLSGQPEQSLAESTDEASASSKTATTEQPEEIATPPDESNVADNASETVVLVEQPVASPDSEPTGSSASTSMSGEDTAPTVDEAPPPLPEKPIEMAEEPAPAKPSPPQPPVQQTGKRTVVREVPVLDSDGNPTNAFSLVTEEIDETPSNVPASRVEPRPATVRSTPPSPMKTAAASTRESTSADETEKPLVLTSGATVFLDLSDSPRPAAVKAASPLRTAPGLEGTVIGTLAMAAPLQITGAARIKKQPHPWYRVFDSMLGEGWVYGESIEIFIRQSSAVQPPTAPSVPVVAEGYPKRGTVMVDQLIIRQTPSRTARILGRKKQGTDIELLGESQIAGEKWFQIALPGGRKGWMLSNYVKSTSAPTDPAVASTTPSDGVEESTAIQPSGNALYTAAVSAIDASPPLETQSASAASDVKATVPPAPASSATTISRQAEVTRNSINVREAPTLSSPVVGRVNRGQALTLVEERRATGLFPWYRIDSPKGWIYGQFLKFSDSGQPQAVAVSDLVESFPIARPARLTGTAVPFRQSHAANAQPIAIIGGNDALTVEVIGQWRGREPYFWYQAQHPKYGVGWIYGQFLRFDDEKSRFPQAHLFMLDIDERYGPSVNDVIRKLGTPTHHDQKTGRLAPMSTSFLNTQLQYPGASLRFLRYFEEDHLLEIDVTDATYPMGNLSVGQYKTDVMLELGEGVSTKTSQGEVLTYTDPVTGRSKAAFTLDKEGKVVRIKKIAWID